MAVIDKTDIVSWQANYSFDMSAYASIILDNKTRKFAVSTEDLVGQALILQIVYDDVPYTVFRGRVKSQKPTYSKSGKKITVLEAVDVPDLLGKKPINTHTYGETEALQAVEILRDLAHIYGALSTDYYDFTLGTEAMADVLVAENSLLEGMKKVAQAAGLVIYRRYDGKLVTGLQQTEPAGIDYEMQPIDIEDELSEDRQELDEISVCKVRGRYYTDAGAYGKHVLFAQQGVECTLRDTEFAVYSFLLSKRYTLTDLFNSNVTVIDPSDEDKVVTGRVTRYEPPYVTVILQNADKDWNGETVTLDLNIEAILIPSEEIDSIDAKGYGHGMKSVQTKTGIHQMLRQAILVNASQDRQGNRLMDERAEARVQAFVGDNVMIARMGIRTTELDNLYIQTEARAEAIGLRTIYESALAGYTFSLQGPFRPALMELNKVVSIPLCTGTTIHERIKCLLVGIGFSYDAKTSSAKSNYTFVKL